MKKFFGQRGFTLIELLIVIGIIAILAAVVMIAINPARQFSQANDTARSSNINAILNAIGQYTVDNKGKLPTSITTTKTEICATGAASCTGLVDLSDLTDNAIYIGEMPVDPDCPTGCAASGTGYWVQKLANNRIFVDAPLADLASISVTR
ncbi:MAG: type II secretion system protein [Patescibacteria group bacterium]